MPGGEAALAVAFHGVGGNGDDGDADAGVPLADLAASFKAVHLGHLAIHEDQPIESFGERVDRLAAVGHQVHLITEFLNHSLDYLLVDGVILGDQDLAAAGICI